MNKDHQIIALICCRGGSKGIPKKNIKLFAEKPLLGWTLETAKESKVFDDIILSTDSEEYFKIACSFNNEMLFHKRTAELAEDVMGTKEEDNE